MVETLSLSSKLPPICWEHNSEKEGLPMQFDGIPYIWLGRREYNYHQGEDKAKNQKEIYKEKKAQQLMTDHCAPVRTKKHTQRTKKMKCPVSFSVKKLFRFPEFRIEKNSKWERQKASKRLREYLLDMRNQNTKEKFGHLEYITTFATGTRFKLEIKSKSHNFRTSNQQITNTLKGRNLHK